MFVSRCCKEIVQVVMDYFMCVKCGRPCDTLCSLNLEAISHDDNPVTGKNEAIAY